MGDELELNGRQASVHAALMERSPKLAGMYRTALENLSTAPFEGCENARISVICHCMRELMANLPLLLAKEDLSPRPEPSSSVLTLGLPKLLQDHPTIDLEADQDNIPIPSTFAKAISALIKVLSQEHGRNVRNAAVLITGDVDTKHPAIKQWNITYDVFLNWTHFDRKHEGGRPLPTDAEILANIQAVEDVILNRTAAFFENVHAIADLLAEINDETEEDL